MTSIEAFGIKNELLQKKLEPFLQLLQKLSNDSKYEKELVTGSKLNIETIDFDLLIRHLCETEILEIDGKMTILPIFLSLPVATQTRLINLFTACFSRIPVFTLLKFINAVKTSKNHWVQEMIRQLASLANCSASYQQLYQFSSLSTQHLNQMIVNLKSTTTMLKCWTNKRKLSTREVSSTETVAKMSTDVVVDVIVLDDECNDDNSNFFYKDFQKEKKLKIDLYQNKDVCNAIKNLTSPMREANVNTSSQHSGTPDKQQVSAKINAAEDIGKEVKTNGQKNDPNIKFSSIDCHQLKVSQLYNACQNWDIEMTSDMLKPFSDMKLSEVKLVCECLNLGQLPDKMLVNICDNMPWQSLQPSSAKIILESCLISKLTSLTADFSDQLLSAVSFIATLLPLILVDIFVHALSVSNSGNSQTQFISSIIKESLPIDAISYLIGQLADEKVHCNDNLISLLQTLLARNPVLNEHSVFHLLSLLSQCTDDNHSNAKLGKVLLSILSKNADMMSKTNKAIIVGIIEKHTSNLKKLLINAVKKFNL